MATVNAQAPAGPASSAAGSRRRRRRLRTLSRRDKLVIALMAGVPLALDIGFIWFPTITSVLLSFTHWMGIGGLGTAQWIGLHNYAYAATTDPAFWPAIEHNLIWLGAFVCVATPFGILLAVLLDGKIRGSRIYQSIFFLPVMLSLALIGTIWELMYSSNYGLINSVLGANGANNAIDWLGNPKLDLWAVLIEACWRQAGYVMILYLAGLKAVDPALREAAVMDGATPSQTFWRVVFPVMRPVNVVIAVITFIESLRAFDIVYITNRGTNGLELLSTLITNNILGETTLIGYGAALGVVLLVVSLVPIITFLVVRLRQERST
ncbi:MAG TPA: sugar ABC transporter permease [Streptosporangiaceae bacterium]|jgi:ABC-type sugar transport system permease subunit|nr:sugar ABC transporter permease [Streptosporangiaceae bacterium]